MKIRTIAIALLFPVAVFAQEEGATPTAAPVETPPEAPTPPPEPTPPPTPAPAPAPALSPVVLPSVVDDDALDALSLEQLLQLDLKVVSVSKRVESLNDASAAIYAITGEEIRRTGHSMVPEALRVVPGVHVVRFDSSGWAISSRGFNGRFSTKMLVLMDGRSAYTPLFGGVFWDVQDTLLEDVERIEVIRGPGGTLWGANAVNGVVNVITRPASATPGLYAMAGGGNEEKGFGGVRWGGTLGGTSYRVYAKYANRDDAVNALRERHHDAWDQYRTGFRADGSAAGATWMVQGDHYGGVEESIVVLDILDEPYKTTKRATTNLNGQNLLTRGSLPLNEQLKLQIQAYYDRTERDDIRGDEWRQTGDLDVQAQSSLGSHHLVVGVGFRGTTNHWIDSPSLSLRPQQKTDKLFNLYAQDEWSLFGDKLRLTLGSKFEHNDFTGFEWQPTARATVRPTDDQTLWAAYSRATRTPDRIERDGTVDFGINRDLGVPIFIVVEGNKDIRSERLEAVEAGYRTTLKDRVIADVAVFRHKYDRLISALFENAGDIYQNPEDGQYYVPIPFTNEPGGTTWGTELSVKWIVTPDWTIAGGYTAFRGALEPENADAEYSAPHDQASLRFYMDLSDRLQWNIAWYWANAWQAPPDQTPGYNRIDIGWTIRPAKHVEIDVWGQNLLDDQHPEIQNDFLFPSAEVERSFYGRVTTRF